MPRHTCIDIQHIDGRFHVQGEHAVILGWPVDTGRSRAVHSSDEGLFARWQWNGQRLTACTDRYGGWPLFYAASNERIRLGSSLAALLQAGVSTEYDPEALAVFFRLGYFLDNDTPFRDIRVLAPDSRLTWDGQLTVDTPPLPVGQPVEGDPDQLAAQLGQLVRRAAADRLPTGRAAVPLSGGFDSRWILFELLAAGLTPTAVTTTPYPPRGAHDVQAARDVAHAVNVEHRVIPPLPRFAAERWKNAATHYLSDEHAWAAGMAEHLQREGFETIYDGTGVDIFIKHNMVVPRISRWCEKGNWLRIADDLMNRRQRALELAFPPALRDQAVWNTARQRVAQAVSRFSHAPNPYAVFRFWNRTRREVMLLSAGMLADFPRVHCPFLDHAVWDFVAGLDPSTTMVPGWRKKALDLAFPQFAHIPFAKSTMDRPLLMHNANLASRVLLHAGLHHPRWLVRNWKLPLQWMRCLKQWYWLDNKWLAPHLLLYAIELERLARTRGQSDPTLTSTPNH